MPEEDLIKNKVGRWIAGDITLSSEPSRALKRWREIFGMSQTELAKSLKISPSVISDYESGRRKSPGIAVIKRIVDSFIENDRRHGGRVIRAFVHMFGDQLPTDIVLDIREFEEPVTGEEMCRAIDGKTVVGKELLDQRLFGYTVIDSIRAVVELSAEEFMRLYGLTTERALIFTRVTIGRSPMVAVKVRGITPGMVVLHGKLKRVDKLGIKIAESLRVPLVVSRVPTVKGLIERLRKISA
ncbi:MAG: helix-turn-helix domain-containing protein [Hadesarchaea archaeon]|nr:helix-turn-helix domain-containing protein [Hadesarchaea archaeon]